MHMTLLLPHATLSPQMALSRQSFGIILSWDEVHVADEINICVYLSIYVYNQLLSV